MQDRLERLLLSLGAAAVLALGAMIAINVALRALFGLSIPDSVVMVSELMVAAILLPLAAATAARAHICVEVISGTFSKRVQSWLIVFGSFVGLLAILPLLWAGWQEFTRNWQSWGLYPGIIELPKWPGRLLFTIGLAAAALRLVRLVFTDTRTILEGGVIEQQQKSGDLE
jgi:TRAP-type C4-dicarboxylate transport system permease small subunit